MPRRVPFTAKVRRGLSTLMALAGADIECAGPNDYTAAQLSDIEAAQRWARDALREHHREKVRKAQEAQR